MLLLQIGDQAWRNATPVIYATVGLARNRNRGPHPLPSRLGAIGDACDQFVAQVIKGDVAYLFKNDVKLCESTKTKDFNLFFRVVG